jgi:hypothetical protein
MSNKPSNQVKPQKKPLVKKTVASINKVSNKRVIQVPLVRKTFVVKKKPTYTFIYILSKLIQNLKNSKTLYHI